MNIIRRNITTEKGKLVRVDVTFSNGIFDVKIDCNHELILQATAYSPMLREDMIYPATDKAEIIAELASDLHELNNKITSKLKAEE